MDCHHPAVEFCNFQTRLHSQRNIFIPLIFQRSKHKKNLIPPRAAINYQPLEQKNGKQQKKSNILRILILSFSPSFNETRGAGKRPYLSLSNDLPSEVKFK